MQDFRLLSLDTTEPATEESLENYLGASQFPNDVVVPPVEKVNSPHDMASCSSWTGHDGSLKLN